MLGFNKQFAPVADDALKTLAQARKVMNVLVILTYATLVISAFTLAAVHDSRRRG